MLETSLTSFEQAAAGELDPAAAKMMVFVTCSGVTHHAADPTVGLFGARIIDVLFELLERPCVVPVTSAFFLFLAQASQNYLQVVGPCLQISNLPNSLAHKMLLQV
jgi:hypothetical protein